MLYPTGLAPRRAKRLSEGVPKGICYALVVHSDISFRNPLGRDRDRQIQTAN